VQGVLEMMHAQPDTNAPVYQRHAFDGGCRARDRAGVSSLYRGGWNDGAAWPFSRYLRLGRLFE